MLLRTASLLFILPALHAILHADEADGSDYSFESLSNDHREQDPEFGDDHNPPRRLVISTEMPHQDAEGGPQGAMHLHFTNVHSQVAATFNTAAADAVQERGHHELPHDALNDPARITRSTDMFNLSPQLALGLANDRMSFNSHEYFALYNPNKKTCLVVKERGLFTKKLKLATERCNMNQGFRKNSPLTFFWIPVENNLALLAQRQGHRILCAHHKRFRGTRFEACSRSSTRYSLSPTQRRGTVKIRNAERSNSCMDADFKKFLNMKPCGRFKDQAWQKIFVSY